MSKQVIKVIRNTVEAKSEKHKLVKARLLPVRHAHIYSVQLV